MRTRSTSSARSVKYAAWNQRAVETTTALRSQPVSSSKSIAPRRRGALEPGQPAHRDATSSATLRPDSSGPRTRAQDGTGSSVQVVIGVGMGQIGARNHRTQDTRAAGLYDPSRRRSVLLRRQDFGRDRFAPACSRLPRRSRLRGLQGGQHGGLTGSHPASISELAAHHQDRGHDPPRLSTH